jgi:hypothetical protein
VLDIRGAGAAAAKILSSGFILDRVEERAKVGLVLPLPLALEFAHLSHGFIPTLHTGLGPALLVL